MKNYVILTLGEEKTYCILLELAVSNTYIIYSNSNINTDSAKNCETTIGRIRTDNNEE